MFLRLITPVIVFTSLLIAGCGSSSSGGGGGAPGPLIPDYYVDSNRPDDTGDGLTPATAKQTINAAIQQSVMDAMNPATVGVSTGTYTVNSAAGTDTHIAVVEGVSLYGGYNADFSQRDSTTFPTIIQDTSTMAIGGFLLTPNRAIESSTGITAATIIDGFTINGTNSGAADYGAGFVAINGASPTVQNNIMNGGSAQTNFGFWTRDNGTSPLVENNTINGGSGGFSYGTITLGMSSPTLQVNTIDGGTGATLSHGIYVGDDSDPVIQQNTSIFGGSSTNTYGILVNGMGTTALIQANTEINGGTATNGANAISASSMSEITVRLNYIHGGTGMFSYGMSTTDQLTTSVVERNRIFAGTGGTLSFGINNSQTAYPIHNNLIHGGTANNSYGVNVNSANNAIRNNTIFAGSTGNSTGVQAQVTAAPVIENNIIYTRNVSGGQCIREDQVGADPAVIANNNLSGCTGTVFKDNDGGCVGDGDMDADNTTCTLAEMELLSGAYQNNTADDATAIFTDENGAGNDINDMTDNDWTLNTAVGNIANGGLNGIDETGWGFTNDFAGTTRPGAAMGAWSMGAYEHP